ncbi:citramalyl-CoA lyase, mitochondrial-like [Corticium candelabrum]|uniref:citramalyl-CoA lyase, mitochondrial-like n=1 Tax=Corticium candelabrum TaxID=121492 RepID=UPI002E26F1E4|nr:citramalyl-CoA lyase, mitochondrial-like [Corticium candelabrum]
MFSFPRNIHRTCLHSLLRRSLAFQADIYRPRRAILYVPGNDERKIRKAAATDVDSVVLDCEDGVAMNRKNEARSTISRSLSAYDFGRSERIVRINAYDSGSAVADLQAVLASASPPDAVILPKVEDAEQVNWINSQMLSLLGHTLPLICLIEMPLALLNLRTICEAGKTGNGQLSGLIFGADDFAAFLGAVRSPSATEVLVARQTVVMHAKAYGLQAIDIVDINYKNLESLKHAAEEGRKIGYTGKQVIHPDQVPIVQQAFSPSEEEVEWAKKLITAFEEHQKSGKGAFAFEGQMVDMPLMRLAQNIMQLMRVTQ